ncbi:MAG: dTDP-4-dehydrorhamnose 3,5-epimerase [Candidatus Sulfotelmatobacter sp.]|nr:dTDP-4-dehydrorhamnose 3,5-epimerase [Candidatus Sulfotelmatobacter sp.]
MKVIRTEIPDVLIFEPEVFTDDRGFFFESFNQKKSFDFGLGKVFIQDNHSHSLRNVLRGLHYQIEQPQGKLVRVVSGEIFDVAVDIRSSSATFGNWVGATLSAENKQIMWIPAGFAHGFLTLSGAADVLYKATDYHAPQFERTIAWDDKDLDIKWPLHGAPILSAKDSNGIPFRDAETYP